MAPGRPRTHQGGEAALCCPLRVVGSATEPKADQRGGRVSGKGMALVPTPELREFLGRPLTARSSGLRSGSHGVGMRCQTVGLLCPNMTPGSVGHLKFPKPKRSLGGCFLLLLPPGLHNCLGDPVPLGSAHTAL